MLSPINILVRVRYNSPAMDRPMPSNSNTMVDKLVPHRLPLITVATVRTTLKARLKRNSALASQAVSHCSNSSSALPRMRRHIRTTQRRKRKVRLPSNARHHLLCNQCIKVPHSSRDQRMRTLRLNLKLRSTVNSPRRAGQHLAILHNLRLPLTVPCEALRHQLYQGLLVERHSPSILPKSNSSQSHSNQIKD